jgi:uncharacterized surface protein with fasciclin (FAS1) repeats
MCVAAATTAASCSAWFSPPSISLMPWRVSLRRIHTTVMLACLVGSSALMVGTSSRPMVVSQRMASPMMATTSATLKTIQGPDLYWEDKGPLQNPPMEESDFKEYDKYDLFLAACAKNGVNLDAAGTTVLAPGNKAVAEYMAVNGPLSKAVCEYHIIKGLVNTDALGSAKLTTVQGGTITYRRMFRKDFVDNAFCAAKSSPPRTSYLGNIKTDNGMIHMINEVIYPGWTLSSGGVGAVGATRDA